MYTARRFASACAKRGWDCDVVDPFLCSVSLGRAGERVMCEGRELSPDVVFNRLASLASDYSVFVASELEAQGALTINPAAPTMQYRHKFTALQALEAAGLPIPETKLIRGGQDINEAVDEIGGLPVIVKYIRGSQGLGVIWGESYDAVTSIVESLNLLQFDVVIQRYYSGARELDLRVLVLGGEVIACVRRVASGDDFRSNFHRGGMLYMYDVPDDIAALAVRSSQALGLHFAGVDIIGGPDGPIVLEVNLSPGFEGMDQAHGIDVADMVVEWAAGKLAERLDSGNAVKPKTRYNKSDERDS